MDEGAAREALRSACADAGVDADEIVFFPYELKPPPTVHRAAFLPPGELVSGEDFSVLDEEAARSIDWQIERKRLMCWTGMEDELIGPVLRHEVEHVRQWDQGGKRPTFQFAGILRGVLGRAGYDDLPCNGQVYNLNPMELDANGAASNFARRILGDDEADRLAVQLDPGVFRRRPEPEPPETLPTRLICHAAVWPSETEQVISSAGYEPRRIFDRARPGGSDLWSALQEDAGMRSFVETVRALTPIRERLDAASSPEEGWREIKEAIRAACDHARGLAGLPDTPR